MLCSGIKVQDPEGTCRCYMGGSPLGAFPPLPKALGVPAQGRQSLPSLNAADCMLSLALCIVLQPLRPSVSPTPAGEDTPQDTPWES